MGGYAIVRWAKSGLGILWRYSIFIIVNPVQKLDLFNIRPLEWPPKCWKMPTEIILLSSLFLTNQNNVNFDKVNHKVQKSDRYNKWTVYQGFHLKLVNMFILSCSIDYWRQKQSSDSGVFIDSPYLSCLNSSFLT